MKRFEIDGFTGMIIDNLTGDIVRDYVKEEVVELLNRESERADRNAELLDIDCVAQYHYCQEVNRILRKYGIDSLEKLDLCLMEQRVW